MRSAKDHHGVFGQSEGEAAIKVETWGLGYNGNDLLQPGHFLMESSLDL